MLREKLLTGQVGKKGCSGRRRKDKGGHGFLFEISLLYSSNQNPCCDCVVISNDPSEAQTLKSFWLKKEESVHLNRRGRKVSIA